MADRASLQTLEEGTRIRALRELIEDPEPVLEGIGALLVSQSNAAFRTGGLGSSQWKDRGETGMNPNWPGILSDLSQGKTPRARRFEDAPVLIDRGGLRRSVDWRVVGSHTVEAGSTLPYAGVLHEGGKSKTVTITEGIQKALYRLIRGSGRASLRAREAASQSPDDEGAARRSTQAEKRATGLERLSWLLNKSLRGQRLEIDHPARPIVGVTDDLARDVEEIYGEKLAAVF